MKLERSTQFTFCMNRKKKIPIISNLQGVRKGLMNQTVLSIVAEFINNIPSMPKYRRKIYNDFSNFFF